MRDWLIIILYFVILACFAWGFDVLDRHLERTEPEPTIEPSESFGPDIRPCLKSDYDGDLWNCIRNGEYVDKIRANNIRKNMFRTDI